MNYYRSTIDYSDWYDFVHRSTLFTCGPLRAEYIFVVSNTVDNTCYHFEAIPAPPLFRPLPLLVLPLPPFPAPVRATFLLPVPGGPLPLGFLLLPPA